MAFLVLGLGLVMGVLGALAIANGYPVIEVERGWATVIAGSTMLAGGVVTIALGLVLRALGDLRKAMAPSRLAPPVVTSPVSTDPGQVAEPHDRAAPAQVHREAEAPLPAVAVDEAGAAHDRRETAAHDAADGYALQTPSTSEHDLVAGGPALDDWLDRAFSNIDRGAVGAGPSPAPRTPAEALEPQIVPPEPAYDVPVRRHDLLDEGHHAERVHSEAPLAEAQHAEAWHAELSRADGAGDAPLSGADHTDGALPVAAATAVGEVLPEPMRADASVPPSGSELVHEDHDAHHATDEALPSSALGLEPLPHDAVDHPSAVTSSGEPDPGSAGPAVKADRAAETNAPEPVVIGRYEAEGTTYTMYADGSIEAQSSAGIYRFASMAELKSFIEG